ncbi:MAG: hypothetical protein ABIA47_00790 [bacterium]
MNIRQYLLTIGIGTAFTWSAWFVVLISIDPVTAGWIAFLLFYLTLFAGLCGLFMTISTVIRITRFPDREIGEIVKTSLRQGITIGALLTAALVLQSVGLLTWWTLTLLIVLIAFIEILMHTKK